LEKLLEDYYKRNEMIGGGLIMEDREEKKIEDVTLQEAIHNEQDNHKEEPKKEEKMFKEEIYDRMPFSYKQVDIFTKVIIGVTIAFVIYAIIVSNLS
jgi:hypothetical protein